MQTGTLNGQERIVENVHASTKRNTVDYVRIKIKVNYVFKRLAYNERVIQGLVFELRFLNKKSFLIFIFILYYCAIIRIISNAKPISY